MYASKIFKLAVATAMLAPACSITTTSGTGSGTDTDDTTSTSSTSSTSSTTSTTTSGTTSQPKDDYWDMGVCRGLDTPSADDCKDVTFEGECDPDGKVIYCEMNKLYCLDCPANNTVCEYDPAGMFYNCVQGGGTSGTSTSTSTSTGG